MMYRPCPICGAALDPGEICDCVHAGKERQEIATAPAEPRNDDERNGVASRLHIQPLEVEQNELPALHHLAKMRWV